MEITVAPISGGNIVYQLGILEKIGLFGYDSDMMMGASGGNIAINIAHASNFKSRKMRDLASRLSPAMFCSHWCSLLPIYSYYYGYTEKGALFDNGKDNSDFFKYAFSGRDIRDREIWAAAYDKGEQKTQLFCNRCERTSMLNNFILDEDIYQACPNLYADGNCGMLAKIAMASASIPGMVPAQKINESYYQDGGLACASPMTLMRHLFDKEDTIHITFIGCEDLNAKERYEKSKDGVKGGLMEARDIVLRNIVANDRRACYELIARRSKMCKCGTRDVSHEVYYLNESSWTRIIELKNQYKRTLVELYPEGDIKGIDITNFTSEQVLGKMNEMHQEDKIICKIWYA